ncbi:MAG: hypothetical protein AAGE89_07475 [Pseudomonadota bacterium]
MAGAFIGELSARISTSVTKTMSTEAAQLLGKALSDASNAYTVKSTGNDAMGVMNGTKSASDFGWGIGKTLLGGVVANRVAGYTTASIGMASGEAVSNTGQETMMNFGETLTGVGVGAFMDNYNAIFGNNK